jgi:hypothetical protein
VFGCGVGSVSVANRNNPHDDSIIVNLCEVSHSESPLDRVPNDDDTLAAVAACGETSTGSTTAAAEICGAITSGSVESAVTAAAGTASTSRALSLCSTTAAACVGGAVPRFTTAAVTAR